MDEKWEDKTLTCKDCGATFKFTAGEQKFYWTKNLHSPPKRCPACRAERKKRINPDKGGDGR